MTQEQISKAQKKNKISVLNRELDAIKEKVILNAEFIAAGDTPPYEPAELHAEAEQKRRRIVELEAEIGVLANG